MADPFVVPTVCRYVVKGTYASRPVANVLDYHIDTTGSTMDRETAIFQAGGIILNEWDDSILPLLSSVYTATGVSWIDLNSATGTVGSRTTSGAHSWPKNGGQLTAGAPGNVAALVTKATSASRGARKGRMYLPGVTEVLTDTTNVNDITTGNVTAWNTALGNFLNDTNQTPGTPTTYVARMVVVHILTRGPAVPPATVGPPLTGNHTFVTSLSVAGKLATQRRRLRG